MALASVCCNGESGVGVFAFLRRHDGNHVDFCVRQRGWCGIEVLEVKDFVQAHSEG